VILLDTHALIWLVEADPKLGKKVRELADQALKDNELATSAITFWEVAMLVHRKRIGLSLPADVWRRRLLDMGLMEIPITGDIGITAAGLQGFHGDPADRFIAATAILRGGTLMTADKAILGWPGEMMRQDARI
jgi:PIN domain nuclease of toxin-antitoxin system